jgi:tripartite-type tricarboxylate transporter receptor subunit TctC
MVETTRRSFGLGLGAITGAYLLPTGPSKAQATFPSQDIQFICGFAAGSGADTYVRFFAEKMRGLAKRNVVVQNRVGALGNIATEFVARSKPDGHTVLITGGSALAANHHILKSPTVDIGNELQVIGTINKQPTMIMVAAESPWKSVSELVEAMKKKGDKGSYALANPSARVVGAMFKEKAGLQSVEVQYKTGAQYLNDLTSGNIDYAIADNVLAVTQANAGRMRNLAVSTEERLQAAPDYPTLRELGFDVTLTSWWGGFVPSATPVAIVNQLGAWLTEIVKSDEGKKFLNGFASDPWASDPVSAQAYFRREIAAWGDYVRIAKIEKQG